MEECPPIERLFRATRIVSLRSKSHYGKNSFEQQQTKKNTLDFLIMAPNAPPTTTAANSSIHLPTVSLHFIQNELPMK